MKKLAGLALVAFLLAGAAAAPAAHHSAVKKKPVKRISLHLQKGRKASKQLVATKGGSISTRAADGTKLTLKIPKNALLEDAKVTMTPVGSVSGLPAGSRFLGGVQLAPEGTALAHDATLTVTTSAASKARELRAVLWTGKGKTPVSYTAKRGGKTVRIRVIHFSGYGADDGPSIPSNWPDIFRAAYTRIHIQMSRATVTDSVSLARRAIGDWLAWERQLQLLGADNFMTRERAELQQVLLPKVIKNMIEKSYKRCKEQHDVIEELAFLRGVQRQVQLLGLGGLNTLAAQRLDQCASFELDFESVITRDLTDARIHIVADVRVLQLKLNHDNSWENQQPLDYFSLEFVHERLPDCADETSKQVDAPFQAKITSLKLKNGAPSIAMNVVSGGATETWTIICPEVGPVTGTYHWWEEGFKTFHQGGTFTIGDWDYLGTSVLARRTYSQTTSVGGATISEQTSFELRHTPE